jgi:hypothetical protein
MTKTIVKFAKLSPLHHTRFPELGFCKFGSDWRIVALDGGDLCFVGPFYKSKVELLADLPEYAKHYG